MASASMRRCSRWPQDFRSTLGVIRQHRSSLSDHALGGGPATSERELCHSTVFREVTFVAASTSSLTLASVGLSIACSQVSTGGAGALSRRCQPWPPRVSPSRCCRRSRQKWTLLPSANHVRRRRSESAAWAVSTAHPSVQILVRWYPLFTGIGVGEGACVCVGGRGVGNGM